jgi:ribosomal protein S18 acetylase RimI-like enzyme
MLIALAMMRDHEAGLGWKYDAARHARSATARLRPWAKKAGGERGRRAITARYHGFWRRASVLVLPRGPSHRRLGIGQRLLEWLVESARVAGMASIHLELRSNNDAARRFYRAMSFYETVLVPGYYRSGEGRKEGALRMLRVLRAPGPVPYTWRPPRTEDT